MKLLHSAALAAAAGLLALTLAQPSMARMDNDEVDITYIIYDSPGNIFWEPALTGVREAAEMLGVNVDIQYSEGDVVKQLNIIETAMANKVDGLAFLVSVDNAFIEIIAKARAEGFGVVLFNDDPANAAKTETLSYVGQDFQESGYKITKILMERWGLKAGDHVAAPVEIPDWSYAFARHEGVQRALDEIGVTSEMFGTGVPLGPARTAIAEYLIGHPETDAIISLGGTPAAVAPQAAEEAGREGLPNGGFDINEPIMNNIMSGKTTAVIDQQPYYQGFLPILFLTNFKRYGLAPANFNTGLAVVDADNGAFVQNLAGTYR